MDFRRALPREIGYISRRWKAQLDLRLGHTGLTQARWHALLELSKAPDGLCQRDLAERVGVKASTLVPQIDDLEGQRLVERAAVDGDRRANLVRLTPLAEPLIGELTRTADALREVALEGISESEIRACLTVLRRISENLEHTVE